METQEILNALTIVKPGLSNKEIIEQSTNFAFQNGRVVTYNDEISISHPLDIGVEGAVRAEELYKFLNKVKASKVLFKQEGGQIFLKAGRSKVTLNCKEIALDLTEIQSKKKWEEFDPSILEAAQFVAFAASKDAGTPALTCVKFKEGLVVATDRYRVAVQEVENSYEFLLPADLLPVLKKIQPTKICIQKEWTHFQTEDGTLFSCRVLASDFPELKDFWIKDGTELNLPEKLDEIVDRAAVFANDEFEYDRMLFITISNGLLTVMSKSEFSQFEESTKIKYDGKDLEFRIIVPVLQDILKKGAEKVLIDQNKIQFEGQDWKYLGLLKL